MNESAVNHAPATVATGSFSKSPATPADGRDGPRTSSAESRARMLWKLRSLWILPLMCEGLLLLAAASLALALGKAMQGIAPDDEWMWLSVACALFLVTRAVVAVAELFMPRVVALVGVGTLGMVSLGLLAGLLISSPWHTTFLGLATKNRLLAAVPLGLFLFRVRLLLRAARYSPSLRDMGHYSNKGMNDFVDRIKKRLEFWVR